MLGHAVVILNWRLLWRSLGQSSGEFWLVIAMTLLAAASMGPPAMELGGALASNQIPPGLAAIILGPWLWSTFLAAFVYSLATGELSFSRQLRAELALRPVSRGQAFQTTQLVWTIGPHALALPSVGLPWLIVLATWLSGPALLTAIAASFVMMRLAAGLLATGSRVLSASMPVAAAAVVLVSAILGVLWVAAPDLIVAWSPPGAVTRIVLDEVTWPAWIGLAAWTFAVAALEFWSTRLEAAPRSAPLAPQARVNPIPASLAFVARLAGCQSMLLHGELLRLVRWRRYQLTWLVGAFLLVSLGSRLDAQAGPIGVVFILIMLVNVAGSALTNLFATDRAAFMALLTAPTGVDAVVHAKVIAILLFCLAAEAAGAAFLLARGVAWPLVVAGLVLAGGFFMWAAATGLVSSVLFPSPSDPQTVGGGLVNTPAAIILVISNGVFFGGAIGVAYMIQSRGWGWLAGGAAGAALVVAAAIALRIASRLSSRLIPGRQERMLAALTAPEARA